MDSKIYTPFDDHEFMSNEMLNYFRKKLEAKKLLLVKRLAAPVPTQLEPTGEKEELTRFAEENEINMRASNRVRLSQYLHQIELALERIADKTYGYCGKTKCPISLRRLEIQPTALYSIEAQEEIEEQAEQEQLRAKLHRQEGI